MNEHYTKVAYGRHTNGADNSWAVRTFVETHAALTPLKVFARTGRLFATEARERAV